MKAVLNEKITALLQLAAELDTADPDTLDLKVFGTRLTQVVDDTLKTLDQITIARALAIFEETPQ